MTGPTTGPSCCAPSKGSESTVAPRSTVASGARPRKAGLRLVDIPAGAFRMGYDGPLANPGEGEGPVRDVEVAAFRIAETPVTNNQFAVFVKETGHVTDAEASGWSFVFSSLVTDLGTVRGKVQGAEWWYAVDGADWRHPYGPGSDAARLANHPVVHVSHADAEAYCAWAGVRLPTEVEWEYAARGGLDQAIYPWGDEHPTTSRTRRCNIWEGSFPYDPIAPDRVGTVPVRSFTPNGFGLYQVAGNVWEWTADPWSVEGVVDETQRVRRGGSYLCHDSYCNRYRVAARDRNAPADSTGNIGFRIAAAPS